MGSLRAPTIGRTAELAILQSRLARGRRLSRGERVVVVAPPGVGKTRLVDEFARELAASKSASTVLRIRLRPELAGGFEPISTLVATALTGAGVDLSERDTARRTVRKRLQAAGQQADRADVVADALVELALPGSGSPEERGDGIDRSILFGAWLDGLDRLAAGRTPVWLVEDLHWASPDVVAFVDTALHRPAPSGRLMVATARPSFIDAAEGWAVDDPAAGKSRLELATLPSTDALGLIHQLVGNALPAPLARRVVEASDGNCLFIEELLRTWIGSSALVEVEPGGDSAEVPSGERWRLTISADEIALPVSVQAIYASQLDDLPTDARQGARRGAVAGRRFPADVLGALGVTAPRDVADELKSRGLVDGPQLDADLGDTFVYRHALLRDAAYASLGRAERADLHVRFARWLEARTAPSSDRMAGAIGGHLARALASAPALAGQVADGLSRDACAHLAAEWLERAGRQASGEGATEAAADFYRRSIALTREEFARRRKPAPDPFGPGARPGRRTGRGR